MGGHHSPIRPPTPRIFDDGSVVVVGGDHRRPAGRRLTGGWRAGRPRKCDDSWLAKSKIQKPRHRNASLARAHIFIFSATQHNTHHAHRSDAMRSATAAILERDSWLLFANSLAGNTTLSTMRARVLMPPPTHPRHTHTHQAQR